MFVSTKGRYALRVLVELAEREQRGESWVPLKDIAENQGISEKYLEAIVKLMVKGDILEGLRGKSGGYRLLIAPEDCSIAHVLRLTEGGIALVSCLTDETQGCSRKKECRTYPMWNKLDNLIRDFLEGVTLADLMTGPGGAGSEKTELDDLTEHESDSAEKCEMRIERMGQEENETS